MYDADVCQAAGLVCVNTKQRALEWYTTMSLISGRMALLNSAVSHRRQ